MGTKIEGAYQADAFYFSVPKVRSMEVDPPSRFMDDRYRAWIEEVADSIFRYGQEQDAVFRLDSAKKEHLMLGRTRRLSVLFINDHPEKYEIPDGFMKKYGGWPLRAVQRKATETSSLDLTIAENADRRSYGPIDYMQACIHCAEVLQLDQKETARRLRLISKKGLPQQSMVSTLLSLAGLPHAALSLINSGKIPLSGGRKLVGLPIPEVNDFVERLQAGEKASALLGELDEARRRSSAKLIPRKASDCIKELERIGTPLAADVAAWLRGDPTVGSLEMILVGEAGKRLEDAARKPRTEAAA